MEPKLIACMALEFLNRWSAAIQALATVCMAILSAALLLVQSHQRRILKAQQETQMALAKLETEPRLILEKAPLTPGYEELRATNPGRVGVVVEEILRHEGRPEPGGTSEGTPLASHVKAPLPTLPFAVLPWSPVRLFEGKIGDLDAVLNSKYIEVRYRLPSKAAPLLSDLWRLEGGRFVLEWAGEKVEEG